MKKKFLNHSKFGTVLMKMDKEYQKTAQKSWKNIEN